MGNDRTIEMKSVMIGDIINFSGNSKLDPNSSYETIENFSFDVVGIRTSYEKIFLKIGFDVEIGPFEPSEMISVVGHDENIEDIFGKLNFNKITKEILSSVSSQKYHLLSYLCDVSIKNPMSRFYININNCEVPVGYYEALSFKKQISVPDIKNELISTTQVSFPDDLLSQRRTPADMIAEIFNMSYVKYKELSSLINSQVYKTFEASPGEDLIKEPETWIIDHIDINSLFDYLKENNFVNIEEDYSMRP